MYHLNIQLDKFSCGHFGMRHLQTPIGLTSSLCPKASFLTSQIWELTSRFKVRPDLNKMLRRVFYNENSQCPWHMPWVSTEGRCWGPAQHEGGFVNSWEFRDLPSNLTFRLGGFEGFLFLTLPFLNSHTWGLFPHRNIYSEVAPIFKCHYRFSLWKSLLILNDWRTYIPRKNHIVKVLGWRQRTSAKVRGPQASHSVSISSG